MALMDFFKKLKKDSGLEFVVEVEKEEVSVQKVETPKVVKLSMGELEEIKWEELASKLKAERILPPSYEKKPAKTTVTLSKAGDPMAIIEFRSTTSDSYRVLMVLENEVYESINAPIAFLKNQAMTEIWKKFKDDVKSKISTNQRLEVYGFREQAKRLKNEAGNLLKLEDLFERESEFLDNYKDCKFDTFGDLLDENYLPAFTIDSDGLEEELVTPFTPKTLEFCVSKLTKEAKLNEAFDLSDFIQKCEEIQTASIYKTGDWKKTIERLVRILGELKPEETSVYTGVQHENGITEIHKINPQSEK